MSYYSDWKCGAIEDWEYEQYERWEAERDRYLEEASYLPYITKNKMDRCCYDYDDYDDYDDDETYNY